VLPLYFFTLHVVGFFYACIFLHQRLVSQL